MVCIVINIWQNKHICKHRRKHNMIFGICPIFLAMPCACLFPSVCSEVSSGPMEQTEEILLKRDWAQNEGMHVCMCALIRVCVCVCVCVWLFAVSYKLPSVYTCVPAPFPLPSPFPTLFPQNKEPVGDDSPVPEDVAAKLESLTDEDLKVCTHCTMKPTHTHTHTRTVL